MTERIPVKYAEGPEEVTVWVWSNSPDPVTVRFPRDQWDEFLENVEAEYGGDLEHFFGDYVTGFIEGDIEV